MDLLQCQRKAWILTQGINFLWIEHARLLFTLSGHKHVYIGGSRFIRTRLNPNWSLCEVSQNHISIFCLIFCMIELKLKKPKHFLVGFACCDKAWASCMQRWNLNRLVEHCQLNSTVEFCKGARQSVLGECVATYSGRLAVASVFIRQQQQHSSAKLLSWHGVYLGYSVPLLKGTKVCGWGMR